MKTARFWTKECQKLRCADGVERALSARGWSDTSIEEAKGRALTRLKRSAESFGKSSSNTNLKNREYDYADSPLAEPVIETVTSQSGAPLAIVTRNGYGARVLNTNSIMFVDLDLDQNPPGRGFLASLFRGAPSRDELERPILAKIRGFFSKNGALGGRLYRTRGGMRLLLTSKQIVPNDAESRTIFSALNADPLYVKLCSSQQSYRARLTPKPWRCDCAKPPGSFPYITEIQRQRFREWEEEYETVIKEYATCEQIGSFGSPHIATDIETIIKIHDRETGCTTGRQLA